MNTAKNSIQYILFCRFTVDLHLDIVVQVIAGIAVTVATHITCFHTFGIDQFAFGSFNIMPIRADTQADGIVKIIIKKYLYILCKIRIVGDLNDNIFEIGRASCRERV